MKVETKNTIATHIVSLFRPDSAFFCEAKTCDAPPMPAIPSPLGECIITSKIKSSEEIICIIQNIVVIISNPFYNLYNNISTNIFNFINSTI